VRPTTEHFSDPALASAACDRPFATATRAATVAWNCFEPPAAIGEPARRPT
jgi:hypothetical protein